MFTLRRDTSWWEICYENTIVVQWEVLAYFNEWIIAFIPCKLEDEADTFTTQEAALAFAKETAIKHLKENNFQFFLWSQENSL